MFIFRPLILRKKWISVVAVAAVAGVVSNMHLRYQNGVGLKEFFCFFNSFFCRPFAPTWQEQKACQGRKNFFHEKRLAFAYGDMLKSPPGARGDFISLSRECKLFFRTKAKKREAPKCLPLWSLAANEVSFHRGHFFLRADYTRNTIALCKAFNAKRFGFRERFGAEDFDCAAFDEEFNEVVHCLGKISKRCRIERTISCFLSFLLRFLVNNKKRAKRRKIFLQKKVLTKEDFYDKIKYPLAPGGILSQFLCLSIFFFTFFHEKARLLRASL
jgi:hypothetical protein